MEYDNLFNLQGKIAVVTGGAGLIGRELVRGLAQAQATVVLADIDKTKSNQAIRQLRNLNLNPVFSSVDITNVNSVNRLINSITRKYSRIDIWINSAYPRTKDWYSIFENTTFNSWRKNIDMQLNGYFICCQKTAEYMKRQKSGSIINLASIYGMLAPDFSLYEDTPMTMPAAYSVIKAGIINFTKFLAAYYGKYNIRINSISVGGVRDRQPKRFIKRYIQRTPLKRMAHPEDITGAAIYLSSDAARYVTGHNLVVDGGFSII